MSSIFEAVRKSSVVRIDEFGEAEPQPARDAKPAGQAVNAKRPAVVAASTPSTPIRTMPVRVAATSPVFPFEAGQHEAGEQYRMIRTKLLHSPLRPQLIVVSSASSGDGKTVTSINLAASLALRGDQPVLLVDCDLRCPRIAEELDLPVAPGLAEVLGGETDLDSAMIRCEQFPQLYVLTAGRPVANPSELLDSARWREFLAGARSRFGTIVADAPPVATVADCDLLQMSADGIVLVLRPNHSNRRACRKALESVAKEKFLGVVLNDVEDWWLWKTPGYGYYRTAAIPKAEGRELVSELQ